MRITSAILLSCAAVTLALGAYTSTEIQPGGNAATVPGCARVLLVEVPSSSVASGTCTLKIANRPSPVFEEQTSYVATTNTVYGGWTNIWRTVVSDGGAVTNRYREYVATTTNNVVTVVTNTAIVATGSIAITNTLPTITCSSGTALYMPTNTFLRLGDTVIRSGTATGPVRMILEY